MNIPFRVDPEFFIFPYLKNQGLIPYTQIADQHFPGGFFFPINFANLGFTTPESFLSLHILIMLLISLLIFKITKKFIAVILFLLLWPFFDGGHLWIDTFISLFTLGAYYFFTRQKWLLTGLLLALSLLFKQTAIVPIAILSIYIYIKNRSISNLGKLLLFPAILLIYILFNFNLQDFYYWTIIFNFTAYVGHVFILSQIPKWLIIFIPTLLLLKKHPWLFIFLLFSLPSYLARPDLVHLQPAAPFLILLLFYFIETYLKKLMIPVLTGLLIVLLIKQKPFTYFHYFDPDTTSVINYLKNATNPKQEIFLLGAQPHIYALSNTIPAGRYFSYQLPWYLKITESKYLDILQSSPPKIIVYDTSAIVDDIPITIYASHLVSYVFQNYSLTTTIGNYQIYERINP